jgi:hypothetical protein
MPTRDLDVAVEKLCGAITADRTISDEEFRRLICRAIRMLVDAHNRSEVEARFRVLNFMGAPGDFGYGTPIGDALRAVYKC